MLDEKIGHGKLLFFKVTSIKNEIEKAFITYNLKLQVG